MTTDIIIMAGGFGERLWPASCSKMPKQFLTFKDNHSFLQESILRALSLEEPGKIIIVTRKEIEEECVRQCKELSSSLDDVLQNKIMNDVIVLAEPMCKHTSAAIMSGIILLNQITASSEHLILVLTSDHVIEPITSFIEDCKTAFKAAFDNNFVCFSIPPSEPSVAYGYIKTGYDLYNDGKVFKIEQFKEKPDIQTAKEYYSSGEFLWNSGMFAFKSNFFLTEMKNCTPNVFNSFSNMIKGKCPTLIKRQGISIVQSWPEIIETYKFIPAIAVDKAIAEKTSHAVAVKSNFRWTDVGSWDTFSEICCNSNNERIFEIESNNNFVYSDIPVALCGVSDLVVVNKNGQLLIMKKGKSSLVRVVSQKMKE